MAIGGVTNKIFGNMTIGAKARKPLKYTGKGKKNMAVLKDTF